MHAPRAIRPTAALAVLLTALALPALMLGACAADDGPMVLRFDRSAPTVSDHPFPDDRYIDPTTGVIYGFTEEQLAALPFLLHLPLTAQVGWWSGTMIRLPFTPAHGQPDRWIDVETVPDAVALYRLEADAAIEVPLADHTVWPHTNSVSVRPAAPLLPGKYGAVVRADVLTTRAGESVSASEDYGDIQDGGDESTDPGFALITAADDTISGRADTLAYFELTVGDDVGQSVLLEAYVTGKVPVDRAGSDVTLDVTALAPPESVEIAVGGAQVLAAGPELVAAVFAANGLGALPTDGIGSIVAGAVSTPNFVSVDVPDPTALFTNETFVGRNPALPFLPSNPLSLSAAAPFRTLPYLAFFPQAAQTPMPVVLAIHGFGLSKESFFSVASALCSSGHAVIAIDNYQHGSRQADIAVPEGDFLDKLDPVLIQLGIAFPDPFINPSFLARSRDRLRQSVVDQLALLRLITAGDGTNDLIDFDGDGAADHFGDVVVVGESLGGIVGTIMAAVSPSISRAVLNVPGADIAAIVRDSPFLAHDTNLLALATASAEGIGLMAGVDAPFLPGTEEREVYDIVAETVIAPADAGTYAPFVLNGGLGGSAPRVLVQLAAADTVIPQNASRRYVRAIAAGAEDLPLLVDGELNQAWFDVGGLDEVDDFSLGLPPSGVAIFPGDHAFLIDFADPATTAAAQLQMVQFLLQP